MSGEPNYKRIVRVLEQRIQAGDYKPGDRLPPERELCDIFGVSRITARQALAALAQRNLVVRRQGQGTFVTRAKVESSLLGFFSISEALKADGRLVSTRVVRTDIVPADLDEATALGRAPGEPVVRVTRVRFVDGEPYALENSALLAARFPGLERFDFGAHSLYDVLARDYTTQLVRARETLAPVMLSREQAGLLNVSITQPALRLIRTTFDADGVATEAAGALIRGDRCQVLFELWADQNASARVRDDHSRSATGVSRP